MGQYFDIIIFAAIAFFVIIMLVRQLGTRVDGEPSGEDFSSFFNPHKNAHGADSDNQHQRDDKDQIIDVTLEEEANMPGFEKYGAMAIPMKQIYDLDQSFDPDKFLNVVENVFEFILDAYVADDRNRLRSFVDGDLAEFLIQEIDKRAELNTRLETNYLIGINEAHITSVALDGSVATIGVDFDSDQIYALYDAKGEVVDGSKTAIVERLDHWVFRRDLDGDEPVWLLIDIRTIDDPLN